MRHFILSGTVLTGSLRMLESTPEACLVALTSRALRLLSSQLRTALGTIDLTAIAVAADKHLRAAARAQIESGRRVHSSVLAKPPKRGRNAQCMGYFPCIRAQHGAGHGADTNLLVRIGAVLGFDG